MMKKEQKI